MIEQMDKQHQLLREQISHGNAMFPLKVHEISTDCGFKERVGCHWHEEYEMMVVKKGAANVHIDDKSYAVTAGNLIFVASNHLHSVTAEEGVSFDFFAIVFHQALINSFVNDTVQRQYVDTVRCSETIFPTIVFAKQQWEKEVLDLAYQIREAFEKRETAYELFIKAKMFDIWYLFYTHAGKWKDETLKCTDYRIDITKSIMEYLRENYDSKISIGELSAKFHMSEGHLCRFFKAMTKMSIVEYVNYYRINQSAELLKETDREIGEIAGMTGFNNISYYNKVFRRYMHVTPSQFRKNLE